MRVSGIIVLLGFLVSCSDPVPTNTGFITKLGNDTLAVEVFSTDGNTFTADVVVRSPQTVLTRYNLTMDETGGIQAMQAFRFDPELGFVGEGELVRDFTRSGDSLLVEVLAGERTNQFGMIYEDGALPFLEYTHWPFELALIRAEQTGADTMLAPMVAGSRIRDFVLADLGDDARTIRHPSRGVMDVKVNMAGELVTLDAGQTTRKLMVERANNIDIETIAGRFKKAEVGGKVFGALSGAMTEEFDVRGVNFRLEYGSPSKRGRDLFGGIVPYGERWRTGANRATHIRISEDVTIGGVEVPSGEYTLFSIPEENGGTLIINTQTGQNGRTYNEELDLGRVELSRNEQSESVEVFTITVSDEGEQGKLNLMWGTTVYSVDIEF